jgi:hypothetical protein
VKFIHLVSSTIEIVHQAVEPTVEIYSLKFAERILGICILYRTIYNSYTIQIRISVNIQCARAVLISSFDVF